ncbi:MAG: nucleoside 2-deoxyribosyltransferase [Candidatus Roizmanbacteria bacterium]|nr:nucleoside 2-deoxyribosyltransferase [Candidatus Roizmanbacteria bacterium]
MKIYFTASTSGNGDLVPLYTHIIHLIEEHSVTLTSGPQIISEKMLSEDKKLTSQQIYERQQKRIEESDLVIAETSKPSHGVGGEIVYALSLGKPVLALVHTKFEDHISPMLAGNPSENLFIEFYEEDSVKNKLSDFIKHIEKVKKRKGKLIVIDGGDGSGKTTQAQLLVDYLKTQKIPVKYVDFPQYYKSFHGKTVGKFLKGEFGKIDEVSPYLASLAYALDRASIKREMDEFLAQGGYIVANRYATSSMAHQAAKCKTEKERTDFLKWIYELEYKVHKIPKENLVIYLHVPYQYAAELSKKRAIQKGIELDIAEKSSEHQKKSEEMYLMLSKKHRHWKIIECVNNEKMLSIQEIHEQVLKILNSRI